MSHRVMGVMVSLLLGSTSFGQAPVTAALVRPWGPGSQTMAFWADLNLNWPLYGSRPLSVDTTTLVGTFTGSQLVNLNPDVLILANTAGGLNQLTVSEIQAITAFLSSPNKRLVGTFHSLLWNATNNTALLPCFGLDPNLSLSSAPLITMTLGVLQPAHPVMSGLGGSFTTQGYVDAEVPADLSWDPGDYLGILLAEDANRMGIVHYWQSPIHDAVYISFMPEYGGGPADRQLVYNACTQFPGSPLQVTLQGPPALGTILGLQVSSPGTPNASYALALSAGSAPGIVLPDGRVIPLNADELFWASLSSQPFFTNTTGVLNAQGMGTTLASLFIPNEPALLGITIYTSGVTFNPLAPSGIAAIGLPTSITFQ